MIRNLLKINFIQRKLLQKTFKILKTYNIVSIKPIDNYIFKKFNIVDICNYKKN
jgi:hypothetical protein